MATKDSLSLIYGGSFEGLALKEPGVEVYDGGEGQLLLEAALQVVGHLPHLPTPLLLLLHQPSSITHIYISLYFVTYTYTYMYTYIYILHTYTYILVYMLVVTCIYYIHSYIYTHTNTHIYTYI